MVGVRYLELQARPRTRWIAPSKSVRLTGGGGWFFPARMNARRFPASLTALRSARARPSMRLEMILSSNPLSSWTGPRYFRSNFSRHSRPGGPILIFSENRPPRRTLESMPSGRFVAPTRNILTNDRVESR